MALYFELTSAQGSTARIALQPGMQRIKADIGDSYRIYDDATGKTPPSIVVKRLDSHMIVEGLPQGVQVELTDFYARCGVSSPCTMLIDTDGLLSSQTVQISPASPPLQALTDGSFVLYPTGYSGEPALAVADGDGFPMAAVYAVGGLALVALAGAGSGGGGSDAPAAVSPSPQPGPTPGPGQADTIPPDQPVLTSDKTVVSRTPSLTGTAEPGATVRLDVDTDRDGRIEASYLTTANGNGQWRIDLATQAPASGALPGGGLPDKGLSLLTVTATDASQNQSIAAQFELMVDASGPGAPRITAIFDDAPARVGVVADNGRTNDRSPTIQGRLDEALSEGERLEVLRDGQVLNVGIAINGLAWSVTDSGLAFGNAYDYTARVVDEAGRASTSDGYRIVVQAGTDNAASITAVTDNVSPRTGNVVNGGATNDSTPTVSGTMAEPLAAGESLQVLRNGAAITAAVIVEGDSWRFTDTRLADGSYTYTARVVDVEGSGPLSGSYRIMVDTVNTKTASITSVTDNVTPGIGIVRDGGSTNDSTPTLSGKLSAGLAGGEELQVLRDHDVISSSPIVIGTSWTFTDTLVRSGDYNYTVRIVDAAGNVGRESSIYDVRLSLPRGAEVEPLAVTDLLGGGAHPAGLLLESHPGVASGGATIAMMPDTSLDHLLAS